MEKITGLGPKRELVIKDKNIFLASSLVAPRMILVHKNEVIPNHKELRALRDKFGSLWSKKLKVMFN